MIFDVNNPGNVPAGTWPMEGHDQQRTGCSDCPEDVATAVEPDPDGERITRVSFAVPSPNPTTGATQFSFAVPSRALLNWDSRDDHGTPLASGQYIARLRVHGPGVSEELIRKLTVLR